MPSTSFTPARHGFHFSNNDIKWSALGVEGRFLCGGMVYAALDYYICQMSIPPDRTAPVEGMPLHTYIQNRQNDAHVNTVPKFTGSWLPIIGGIMKNLVLNMQAEYDKLLAILNRGIPAPMCLVGDFAGHHVLAIGTSPAGGMLVQIYDPNSPDKVATVRQSADGQFTNTASNHSWKAFFVDDGYTVKVPTVLSGQDQWRWCRRCQGLFFSGGGSRGLCPSGGGHDSTGSGNYVLSDGTGSGQQAWRWCWKCQGLFFTGNGWAGLCPEGGIHNGIRSGNYALSLNGGVGQQNWRWCRACDGLFFAGAGSLGVCPANPLGHDGSASGNYYVPVV